MDSVSSERSDEGGEHGITSSARDALRDDALPDDALCEIGGAEDPSRDPPAGNESCSCSACVESSGSSPTSMLSFVREQDEMIRVKAPRSKYYPNDSGLWMYWTTPRVRDCSFEQFEAPFNCCIETLVFPGWMEEDGGSHQEMTGGSRLNANTTDGQQRSLGTPEGPRLDRVRINSAYVLAQMAQRFVILKLYPNGEKHAVDVAIIEPSKKTPRSTGSDLKNILQSARVTIKTTAQSRTIENG